MIAIFATSANAQIKNKTPRGDKRMDVQKTRIKNGVKNGSLTKKETARIRSQRKQIKSKARVAKSDGVVTRKERHSLRRDLNKSSKTIYRSKHNKRTRK